MTRNEIIAQCTCGTAEDIDGNYYQLYDANKVYRLAVEKACKWMKEEISGYVTVDCAGCVGPMHITVDEDLVTDFLEAMEDKA